MDCFGRSWLNIIDRVQMVFVSPPRTLSKPGVQLFRDLFYHKENNAYVGVFVNA